MFIYCPERQQNVSVWVSISLVVDGKVGNHPFGNKLLLTKLFYHGQILLLRHLHRERQHDAPGKLGVPLVLHSFYGVPEDVLQEVFLYVAKNFSKIHRENCHELAAYLVSCSRSRAYDMLRKQREELLEDVPNEPDAAPVPDDAAVSTDNIERLTELIGQMKPMYRDPLRLLAMGYTNREIAKSLGLTDEVVRTRLFRGRKLLWKEMNSHE